MTYSLRYYQPDQRDPDTAGDKAVGYSHVLLPHSYFFRGFFFLLARFAAALPFVVYGYFLEPTLGITQSFLESFATLAITAINLPYVLSSFALPLDGVPVDRWPSHTNTKLRAIT